MTITAGQPYGSGCSDETLRAKAEAEDNARLGTEPWGNNRKSHAMCEMVYDRFDEAPPGGRRSVSLHPGMTVTDRVDVVAGRAEESDDFADAVDDPRVRACARYWAYRLRVAGILDRDADDLRQDAYLRATVARVNRPAVDNPVAYLCKAIERNARDRLARCRLVNPVEPGEEYRYGTREEPGYWAVIRAARAMGAQRYLDENRAEVWGRATAVLGRREPADAIFEASRFAVGTVCVSEYGQSWRTVLEEALGRQPYFADRDVKRDTLAKRIDRGRPWVSYLMWEAVHASADHDPLADLDPILVTVTWAHRQEALRVRGYVEKYAPSAGHRKMLNTHIAQLDQWLGEWAPRAVAGCPC